MIHFVKEYSEAKFKRQIHKVLLQNTLAILLSRQLYNAFLDQQHPEAANKEF